MQGSKDEPAWGEKRRRIGGWVLNTKLPLRGLLILLRNIDFQAKIQAHYAVLSQSSKRVPVSVPAVAGDEVVGVRKG